MFKKLNEKFLNQEVIRALVDAGSCVDTRHVFQTLQKENFVGKKLENRQKNQFRREAVNTGCKVSIASSCEYSTSKRFFAFSLPEISSKLRSAFRLC